MRIWLTALLLWSLTFPLSARAEEPIVPQAGWFAGLGGSFNSANFDQDMFANGVGNVFSGTKMVATGAAGGPADPRENTEWTLAPEAQLGYFAHFAASNWRWGGKSSTDTWTRRQLCSTSPPRPELHTVSGPDLLMGNVVIGSYRTKLDHEFAFMPFIGHSFTRSYVYMGAGPALFGTDED